MADLRTTTALPLPLSLPLPSQLPLPPVAEPYHLPFHYGALHQLGVDYLVDPAPARELLAERHPQLSAADFGGRACVSVNFQLYFAQYPGGAGVTQEVEVSIIAYPTVCAPLLPRVDYAGYARGHDQTRLLGIARIHVVCDNPLAIDAGTRLYAEPKYPGWFEATMPSLNGPSTDQRWSVACRPARLTQAGQGLDRQDGLLFSLDADLTGLPFEPVNNAPVTGYGTDPQDRLLAGPMNVYQPYRYHELSPREAARVRLAAGGSGVGRELATLLGTAPPVGAWTFQSPPVAAHNRPYYLPATL
ncbi:hypothetical protein GCM10009665_40810 [Kitasatospora nipponensis]|uniref:Acetoacetate decarboxylase n=1 Tax=Kitasatospora nipponensis TaxID=258049 RepID=A0ABN1WGJ4_9ACTN